MNLAASFPLLVACLLFRLGILEAWQSAGIASIGPIMHSILFLVESPKPFQSQKARVALFTGATVYLAALLFLTVAPEIHLLWYAVLYFLFTYITMLVAFLTYDYLISD